MKSCFFHSANEFVQITKAYRCVTYIQTFATFAFFINKHSSCLELAIKINNGFTTHIDTLVNN